MKFRKVKMIQDVSFGPANCKNTFIITLKKDQIFLIDGPLFKRFDLFVQHNLVTYLPLTMLENLSIFNGRIFKPFRPEPEIQVTAIETEIKAEIEEEVIEVEEMVQLEEKDSNDGEPKTSQLFDFENWTNRELSNFLVDNDYKISQIRRLKKGELLEMCKKVTSKE